MRTCLTGLIAIFSVRIKLLRYAWLLDQTYQASSKRVSKLNVMQILSHKYILFASITSQSYKQRKLLHVIVYSSKFVVSKAYFFIMGKYYTTTESIFESLLYFNSLKRVFVILNITNTTYIGRNDDKKEFLNVCFLV